MLLLFWLHVLSCDDNEVCGLFWEWTSQEKENTLDSIVLKLFKLFY